MIPIFYFTYSIVCSPTRSSVSHCQPFGFPTLIVYVPYSLIHDCCTDKQCSVKYSLLFKHFEIYTPQIVGINLREYLKHNQN